MYPDVQLFINGRWRKGGNPDLPILNPATEEKIGWLANATEADLDEALEAADRAFQLWKAVPALTRSNHLRKVGALLRERNEEIARIITQEQGKPLAEARLEAFSAAEMFEWFAEEARRVYGRTIPSRFPGTQQIVEHEPVGPVAAFSPWNFPIAQLSRKIGAALAAGCSVIAKAAEDTPGAAACLVKAIEDAGVPAGTVNLVFGNPPDISNYLIPHPMIRKISFTGSTPVGKMLAALAGKHMKRITMELGGHAPVIVFDDADIDRATTILVGAKFRNAGQVCISPTRFIVQEKVFEEFVDKFTAKARQVVVGNGLDDGVAMGPLVNRRRVEAIESLVGDAISRRAQIHTGGERTANKGCFFQPTVVTGLTTESRLMNEEPFGPVALVSPFATPNDAIAEANRLPFGLASYAYTRSAERAALAAKRIQAGMVSINHHGLGAIETPFGGVKDSGFGSEGGPEAIEGYLNTKFVSHFTGVE